MEKKTKKGTATKKGKKRQADSDEESKQSSSSKELNEEPYESDDQIEFNEKESIDLQADDVVPVKKNKKVKSGRKSNRYEDEDDEDNKKEEADVTVDMDFNDKKPSAKTKGKTLVDLNKSNMSYRSGWQDRSSVTTSLSRKAQTLEQYLQPIFGEQFYNLVMLLQAEQ